MQGCEDEWCEHCWKVFELSKMVFGRRMGGVAVGTLMLEYYLRRREKNTR